MLAAIRPDVGVVDRGSSRTRAVLPSSVPARVEDTVEQAELLAALYRSWDAEVFGALMVDGADATVLEETLEWFHARLGTCGAPEVLAVSDAGSIRWLYPCAGGELEAELVMEDDRVRRMMLGAHRIEPPAEVRAAADAVLALQRGWNDALFAAHFSDAFDRAETRDWIAQHTDEWGLCTLGNVDLGGARGGLLDVDCTHGPRLLKVQLDDDDRLVETWFAAPREY